MKLKCCVAVGACASLNLAATVVPAQAGIQSSRLTDMATAGVMPAQAGIQVNRQRSQK